MKSSTTPCSVDFRSWESHPSLRAEATFQWRGVERFLPVVFQIDLSRNPYRCRSRIEPTRAGQTSDTLKIPFRRRRRRRWPRGHLEALQSKGAPNESRNTSGKPPQCWRKGTRCFFSPQRRLLVDPCIHGVWRRFRTIPKKKRGKMTDRENRRGFTSIHDGKSIRYFIRFAVNGLEGASSDVAVAAPRPPTLAVSLTP